MPVVSKKAAPVMAILFPTAVVQGGGQPWAFCGREPKPTKQDTISYDDEDKRTMNALMEEVREKVEQMNQIMRKAQDRPLHDGDRLVQFTLFTGCDDGKNGPMMQFIQQDDPNEIPTDEHGQFWFTDLVPGDGLGGGGGGGQPSGGCHCPVNQVSCEGSCPC